MSNLGVKRRVLVTGLGGNTVAINGVVAARFEESKKMVDPFTDPSGEQMLECL